MSELRETCKKCNGKGYHIWTEGCYGLFIMIRDGDTLTIARLCKECYGTGVVEKSLEKSE